MKESRGRGTPRIPRADGGGQWSVLDSLTCLVTGSSFPWDKSETRSCLAGLSEEQGQELLFVIASITQLLFKLFHCEITSDLKKSCKKEPRVPCASPHPPTPHVDVSDRHGAMIKTEKFTSARWYYLNDERCLDFMCFPLMSCSRSRLSRCTERLCMTSCGTPPSAGLFSQGVFRRTSHHLMRKK